MKLVDGIYHVDKRFKFAAHKPGILAWPWYRIHQINQPTIIKLINVKNFDKFFNASTEWMTDQF